MYRMQWGREGTVRISLIFIYMDMTIDQVLNKTFEHNKSSILLRLKETSVAEPEPVEPKLFGTWSRSRSRN